MNKQNKKKKVDLSEGALSDPQGCLVPCHTLGSGLTFCHFPPLAPLPSALSVVSTGNLNCGSRI